ncbi:hypothetical protein [Vibrio parahaemolyticus]|uniref:hypothetical protein n=1 Tax=Vibrio parahaemolyticus TaxID=670 RepID=UPI001122F910|nr:hypothetical protein [Vibrio parahaemolyticus]
MSLLYQQQKAEKQEQRIVNAISFDSWAIQRARHYSDSWLDDTLRLFNQLVRDENMETLTWH